MTIKNTLGAVFCLAVAALPLTACSGDDVETKSETAVNAVVQQHADTIAGLVGSSLRNAATSSSGCTGRLGESSDQVYSVQGVYNLDQPAGGKRLETLARVRADWQAKGYVVTDDRETGTDQGVLAAQASDDFKLDIETTTGAGFAVIIHSPCFERP